MDARRRPDLVLALSTLVVLWLLSWYWGPRLNHDAVAQQALCTHDVSLVTLVGRGLWATVFGKLPRHPARPAAHPAPAPAPAPAAAYYSPFAAPNKAAEQPPPASSPFSGFGFTAADPPAPAAALGYGIPEFPEFYLPEVHLPEFRLPGFPYTIVDVLWFLGKLYMLMLMISVVFAVVFTGRAADPKPAAGRAEGSRGVGGGLRRWLAGFQKSTPTPEPRRVSPPPGGGYPSLAGVAGEVLDGENPRKVVVPAVDLSSVRRVGRTPDAAGTPPQHQPPASASTYRRAADFLFSGRSRSASPKSAGSPPSPVPPGGKDVTALPAGSLEMSPSVRNLVEQSKIGSRVVDDARLLSDEQYQLILDGLHKVESEHRTIDPNSPLQTLEGLKVQIQLIVDELLETRSCISELALERDTALSVASKWKDDKTHDQASNVSATETNFDGEPADLQSLRSQLENLHQEVSELRLKEEEVKETHLASIEALQAELRETLDSRQKLMIEHEVGNATVKQLEAELAELMENRASSSTDFEANDLNRKVADLQQKLLASQQEAVRENQRREYAERALITAENSLTEARDLARSASDAADAQASALRAELTAAKADLAAAHRNAQAENKQSRELSATVSALQKSLGEADAVSEARLDAERRVIELQGQLSAAQQALLAEKKRAAAQQLEQAARAEALQDDLAAAKRAHQDAATALNVSREAHRKAQAEVSSLQLQLSDATSAEGERDTALAALRTARHDVDNLEADRTRLASELAAKTAALAAAAEREKAARADAEQAAHDADDGRRQVAALKTENSKLKTACEDFEGKLREASLDLDRQVTRKDERLASLARDNESLSDKLGESHSALLAESGKLSLIEGQVSQATAAAEAAAKERELDQQKIGALEKELRLKSDGTRVDTIKFETEIKIWKEKSERAKTELVSVKSGFEDERSSWSKKTAQLEEDLDELRRAKAELQEANRELRLSASRSENAQTELAGVRENTEQLEKALTEVSSLLQASEERESELAAKLGTAEIQASGARKLETRCVELARQVQNLHKELEESDDGLKRKESELESTTKELRAELTTIEARQKEAAAYKRDSEKTRKEMNEELTRLRSIEDAHSSLMAKYSIATAKLLDYEVKRDRETSTQDTLNTQLRAAGDVQSRLKEELWGRELELQKRSVDLDQLAKYKADLERALRQTAEQLEEEKHKSRDVNVELRKLTQRLNILQQSSPNSARKHRSPSGSSAVSPSRTSVQRSLALESVTPPPSARLSVRGNA